MAGAVEQNRLVFVVEINSHSYEYHFVEIDIKAMFYPNDSVKSVPSKSSARARATATANAAARAPRSMRRLPTPMAQIRTRTDEVERIDFALAGNTIAGVSTSGTTTFTMMPMTLSDNAPSAGPELQSLRGRAYLVPLGHRLYALSYFTYDLEQPTCLETLPLPVVPASRLQEEEQPWRALPGPPPGSRILDAPPVTAYLAAGTRLWVSGEGTGTYTFDTVGHAWRKEGDWELPFDGRGLVVPELSGFCFGICPRRNCLCACDVRRSPPTVEYVWEEETRPRWQPSSSSAAVFPERSLVYLGNGKFCISRNIGLGDKAPLRPAILLMALQVVASAAGKLRVVKHKVRFYDLPSHGEVAHALQPDFN